MWKLRNNIKAFQIVWNDYKNKMISSFDGVYFHPSSLSEQKEHIRLWPHSYNHLLTIQSSINLITNINDDDGGRVVWPQTHKIGIEFYKTHMKNYLEKTDQDYIGIPNDVLINIPIEPSIVPCGTYGNVGFSSHTLQYTSNRQNSHDRLVAFVCMVPKPLVPKK